MKRRYDSPVVTLFGSEYIELPVHLDHQSTFNADAPGLCCPVCNARQEIPSTGMGNLHQCDVHIFSRHEDATQGTVVHVNHEKVTTETSGDASTNNPSARRSGMLVAFHCESCHGEDDPSVLAFEMRSENERDGSDSGVRQEEYHYLSMFQHKGSTYLSWLVHNIWGQR